jgi:putative glutamine amidotransferase
MARPLIGITAYTRYAEKTGWKYDVCYAANAAAIHQAGGLPVLIPAGLDEASLREIYDRLDGVMLPGGGDIAPENYGMDDHPTLAEVNQERDAAEIAMARWSMEDDRPVFGICRGIQVLNVALGGTLTRDIPSMLDTALKHDIPRSQPRSTRLHTIDIQPETKLSQILGDTGFLVNSLHHQAIASVPSGAVISAHAPDGIIEGIEFPHKHFALAVQWHPEDLTDDARMRQLFRAFVDASRQAMKA